MNNEIPEEENINIEDISIVDEKTLYGNNKELSKAIKEIEIKDNTTQINDGVRTNVGFNPNLSIESTNDKPEDNTNVNNEKILLNEYTNKELEIDPKSNSSKKHTKLLIVLLLILSAVSLGFGVYGIMLGNKYKEINNNSNEKKQTNIEQLKTYKYSYKGFSMQIPINITVTTPTSDEEYPVLTNDTNKWTASVLLTNKSYEEIIKNKNIVKENLEKLGIENIQTNQKKYNNIDFILFEGIKAGEYVMFAYAPINPSYILGYQIYTYNNESDYSMMNDLSNIVKSCEQENLVTNSKTEEKKYINEAINTNKE